MLNTQGKLDNIVRELKHVLSFASANSPPVSAYGTTNMTQQQWDENKLNKIGTEIRGLVNDL